MLVRFRESGDTYVYFGVPKSVFRDALTADSVGRFFAMRIRDHYRYERLSLGD